MAVHHRAFPRPLNGLVWRLLARTDRTGDDDARMVDAAHASQYHWREAGGPRPPGAGGWSPTMRAFALAGTRRRPARRGRPR